MLQQRHTYATPAEVWERIETNADSGQPRPAYLLRACEAAAARIDRYCRRIFVPFIETQYYDRPRHSTRFWLRDELWSLTSLTVGRYVPVPWLHERDFWLRPNAGPPWKWVEAEPGRSFVEGGEVHKTIAVSGTWARGDATEPVGEVDTGGIDASATALPVADDGGADFDGMLLKLEDEWLYCTSATAESVTVQRGILGSTAAAHSAGTTIERVVLPDSDADVHEAAVALTVRAVRQAQSAYTDIAGVQLSGALSYSRALPSDVADTLNKLRRTRLA